MGRIRWYKRDPDAALAGMSALTLEERGAYNTVLDLIYSLEGNLLDDDRFIAGWLRCDIRVWKRIRQRLIDLEKLYLHGGRLRNPKADAVIDEALGRVLSASDAGRASAAKREANSKLIKELGLTVVQRPFEPSISRKKDITTSVSGTAREEGAVRLGDSPAVVALRERQAKRRKG